MGSRNAEKDAKRARRSNTQVARKKLMKNFINYVSHYPSLV
jgi:hypothetical protein